MPSRKPSSRSAELPARVAAPLPVIERYLARTLNEADIPASLRIAMEYAALGGGKRLRPLLAWHACEAAGGEGEASLPACAALEFVHCFSLVHDDLPALDNDDLRRGRPTLHVHAGEAMAILAGDALLTDALALLATGPTAEQAVRGRLVSELALAAGAGGMVGGQVLDIAEDRPAQLDYLVRLHRMKTGALIKASCRMGAIAGRGDEAAVNAAELYGDAIGLAFQIADDLLDVTASAEVLGKPTGADAAAGRHTFPAVVGLEASKKMAQDHVARAVDAVKLLEPEPGPLAALARYSIERSN